VFECESEEREEVGVLGSRFWVLGKCTPKNPEPKTHEIFAANAALNSEQTVPNHSEHKQGDSSNENIGENIDRAGGGRRACHGLRQQETTPDKRAERRA
jgi:hypothetical protein